MYLEALAILWQKTLLEKARGFPFCNSIAPMASPETSVWMIKYEVKFERERKGAEAMAYLSFLKKNWASPLHLKESFFNKDVSGWVIKVYPLMNLR